MAKKYARAPRKSKILKGVDLSAVAFAPSAASERRNAAAMGGTVGKRIQHVKAHTEVRHGKAVRVKAHDRVVDFVGAPEKVAAPRAPSEAVPASAPLASSILGSLSRMGGTQHTPASRALQAARQRERDRANARITQAELAKARRSKSTAGKSIADPAPAKAPKAKETSGTLGDLVGPRAGVKAAQDYLRRAQQGGNRGDIAQATKMLEANAARLRAAEAQVKTKSVPRAPQSTRPKDTLVGREVRYGSSGGTAKVVGETETHVTIANPDAGRVFGNRNRAPSTQTYKKTSKRLHALTGGTLGGVADPNTGTKAPKPSGGGRIPGASAPGSAMTGRSIAEVAADKHLAKKRAEAAGGAKKRSKTPEQRARQQERRRARRAAKKGG